MTKVHTFADSHEAYDASQTRDSIEDGDVLSVPSEHVIGVLVGAWPVAVIWDPDSQIGCFHRLADDTNVGDIDGKDYGDSFELAVMVASERSPCPNCGEAAIGSGGNYNPLDVDVTLGHAYSGPDAVVSTTIGPGGCPVCNTSNERTP